VAEGAARPGRVAVLGLVATDCVEVATSEDGTASRLSARWCR